MEDYQKMLEETFKEIVQIGKGGGGTVFKAYHKRLEKEVVLKKINVNQLSNIERRAELNILKDLKHAYIPQIYDFIDYGNEVFTVMEYIPGQSFAQLLHQKKKFSQKDVAKWLRQLCEVVDYLHSQKTPIIHCDIKPANLMLTPEGNICLIDFNISGVKTDEGVASIGFTKEYAPIEQFAVIMRRAIQKAKKSQVMLQSKPKFTYENDSDKTEVFSETDSEKTEIATDLDSDKTEIASDETETFNENSASVVVNNEQESNEPIVINKKQESNTTVAVNSRQESNTRSLLKSLTDEEWVKAVAAVNAMGTNLMVDEKTDIYSVGTTMYHIITGEKPQIFYEKNKPILQVNKNVSESLAYVIEKAMEMHPDKRFKNSKQLLKTVQKIGVVDKRYKSLSRKQIIVSILMGIMIVLSAITMTFGRSTMQREVIEQYDTCIEQMETAVLDNKYDIVEENFNQAIELFPNNQEAYYIMAISFYEQKMYEEAVGFLSDWVYTNAEVVVDEKYGRFYYISGNCCFELEEYQKAIAYYEKALELQPEEVLYYRDYVVSLARVGEIDKAEQALKTATDKGLSSDVLSLLTGEIAILKGDYASCEEDFKFSIQNTQSDYIKLRAYSKLDEAYELMYAEAEQYEKRIVLLKEALDILPQEYKVTLMERLAQVYINYSDIADTNNNCENAIAIFKDMESANYATFTSRYNIAILYEKIGNYSEAMTQLDYMLDIYPDNYNIYKRKAFVELSVQSEKNNLDREYTTFREYYNQAMTLYKENGGVEDVEMMSLQQLYDDVVANGWL